MNDTLWTAEDATTVLDPPMSLPEVRHMIALMGIPCRGRRDTKPRAGRRPKLYAPRDILDAHAIVIDARARFGGHPTCETNSSA
jgi:hypothetical protein